MVWQDPQALYIFAPPEEPYGINWVEQLLGTVIKPLCQRYEADIRWLWVTRYANRYTDTAPPLGYSIPQRYWADGWYRYTVFRLSTTDTFQQSLQAESLQLARTANCFTDPKGWINYDIVADLGGDRFIRADAKPDERKRRAQAVANFMDATIRLTLDALVQDSAGRWVLEPNTSTQNPEGSLFQSVHHVFCNVTQVPTSVILSGLGNQWQIKTYGMQPVSFTVDASRQFHGQIPVRY